jgi:hypothetical protein
MLYSSAPTSCRTAAAAAAAASVRLKTRNISKYARYPSGSVTAEPLQRRDTLFFMKVLSYLKWDHQLLVSKSPAGCIAQPVPQGRQSRDIAPVSCMHMCHVTALPSTLGAPARKTTFHVCGCTQQAEQSEPRTMLTWPKSPMGCSSQSRHTSSPGFTGVSASVTSTSMTVPLPDGQSASCNRWWLM